MSAEVPAVRAVGVGDVARLKVFLERHVESSMFLLSNLVTHGHELGEHTSSGNFHVLEAAGEIVAAFVLARRGNLLLQAGECHELGGVIARYALRVAERDGLPLRGVLGPWEAASAAWEVVAKRPGFRPTVTSREPLFSLDLARVAPPDGGGRALAREDYEQFCALSDAYVVEENLPPAPGSPEQRRSAFERAVADRRWWGCDQGGRLVAIAGLNAVYGKLGQVGGVFTDPSQRRRGLSRQVMGALLWSSRCVHGLERMMLFTGENNVAARRLYESLGFEAAGAYALLFGETG